jgi:hypothetical protein
MVQTSGKKYQGNSSGIDATFEAALKNALATAAEGENTNHFFWKLCDVDGDFGGIAVKNINVAISIRD